MQRGGALSSDDVAQMGKLEQLFHKKYFTPEFLE
jgi:hypothetical protein